jgi:hypothetical protein
LIYIIFHLLKRNASHIPATAPAPLARSEVNENELTPNRDGTYPPIIEPTVINRTINFFEGIYLTSFNDSVSGITNLPVRRGGHAPHMAGLN